MSRSRVWITTTWMARSATFWIGLAVGVTASVTACELPYVSWHAAVAPVDARPVIIRQDAKGDGRFLAPRSGNRRHRGIDLVAPLDSSVRAIRSGRVVQVGTHRGLGRYVELEHRYGLHSLYAHLNAVHVMPGDRVRQGAVIGSVGKTGNARHPWITPHVHLEVLKDGEPIDPRTIGLKATEPGALPNDETRRAEQSLEARDASGGE